MYQSLCGTFHFSEENICPMNPLFTSAHQADLVGAFEKMPPNSYFVCEDGGIPDETCTYHVTVVRTDDTLFLYNSNGIITYQPNNVLRNMVPNEEDWKQLFIKLGNRLEISHYDYLELIIESFWKQVFDKSLNDMWCGGIITSHGDKGYSYRHKWEENGVPFKRGMMIFLLSYTKLLGDRPKHESCEWVIEEYPKYIPFFEVAEKEAGVAA